MTRRTTRTGEKPRAPFEQAVALRFKHFGEFTDELAANVSTGGMFIRTRNPHPVGSVFEFELQLGDGLPPVAGKAQVAWVRRRSQDAEAPTGMGVRFVELEEDSRRHIAELVAAREASDGRPFEIAPATAARAAADPVPGAAAPPVAPPRTAAPPADVAPRQPAAATADVPPAHPVAWAMSEGAKHRSRRLPWILLAIALLAALTSALWPRPAPAPRPAATSAAAEPPRAPTAAAATPRSGEPAAKPAQLRLVDDWARAWSEQRIDAYLEAYSPRFTPPPGLDRAAWETQRRSRVLAPQWIAVDLAFVELEETDTNRSRVRFVQAYESDSYRDVVRKTLDLERTEGGWKILRELVEP